MTVEIPLGGKKHPGLVALVDDEDVEKVQGYSWYPISNGATYYARAKIPGAGGRTIRMHRLIVCAPLVDHVNHDGLDNRRANLRGATPLQNMANKRAHRGSSSRYKGVGWVKRAGVWHARIRLDGRLKHLGTFADEVEAAQAYDCAALEHFDEFACINFPNESTGAAT